MIWLVISLIAYFLLGLNNALDKFFLASSKRKEDYITYTFYIATLGLVVFVLAPFGLTWPGWYLFAICLAAGAIFVLALLFLYKSLDLDQASRIVPLVGGGVSIFSLIISSIFLAETLRNTQYLSFIFLVAGLVLVTYKKSQKEYKKSIKIYITAILAALFFAIYYVLNRFLFLNTNFISGFILVRVGAFLVVIMFLFPPHLRKIIFTTREKLSGKKQLLFLTNQGIGGLGTALVHYAVSLINVALVNAMQGVQYIFVLIFALLFSRKYPDLFREKTTRFVIIQKIAAVILVIIGLWMLFI